MTVQLASCQCPGSPRSGLVEVRLNPGEPCPNTATAEDLLCNACRDVPQSQNGQLVAHGHNASLGFVELDDGGESEFTCSTLTAVYQVRPR